MIGAVARNPLIIIVSALLDDLLGDFCHTTHIAKKIDNPTFIEEIALVTVDHNSVKTEVIKLQPGAKEFKKELHRWCPDSELSNRIITGPPMHFTLLKISNIFG